MRLQMQEVKDGMLRRKRELGGKTEWMTGKCSIKATLGGLINLMT